MIRRCTDGEFDQILSIVNDGARAYNGVIPSDCYHEPYITREALASEITDGIEFWGYEESGTLDGVMGIQQVRDATLIRHAYVATGSQRRGIGALLLNHLVPLAKGPILIGTWADASWAIRFYERHGFEVVSPDEKNRLLKTYWTVPERQIDTSVVLADQRWRVLNGRPA